MYHSPSKRSKRIELHPQLDAKERNLVLAVFANGPVSLNRAFQILAGQLPPRRITNLIEELRKSNQIRVVK